MSQYKETLNELSKSYMEKLFHLLIEEKLIHTTDDTEQFPLQKKTSPIEENESIPRSKYRKFLEQLHDFQHTCHVVYNQVSPEKASSENLVNMIDYFNEIGVLNIPLKNDKVFSLLENLQNIREEDITEEWYQAFTSNKIDIQISSISLLEHFSLTRIKKVGETFRFITNPNLIEYPQNDFILSAKVDHSRLLLVDVKFRTKVNDLQNILFRGLERLAEYPLHFQNTTKYLAVVTFTRQQEHELSRLVAQFQKLLVETDSSLLNRVFLIPVSIDKIESLEAKLPDVYEALSGLDVTFDYSNSPLDNGWIGPPNISQLDSIFIHEVDSSVGNVLHLKLPSLPNPFYIDYKLVANQRWKFNKVIFLTRLMSNSHLYVELQVRDDNNRYWLKVMIGDSEPKVNPQNRKFEYFIFIPASSQGAWHTIIVDVPREFEKTFGKDGLELNRIAGVRLRGEVIVSKIGFE